MNDLVRVLRGQRIDGRGADEIMRRAADEIERLRSQLAGMEDLYVQACEQRDDAVALLRDIAEMRVHVLPSRFMDESMAEAARAFLAGDQK